MPTTLTGRHSGSAYIGVEASQPPNMLAFPRNPTTTDYQNYFIGDYWLNTNRTDPANFESLWYYASQLQNVATWIRLSTGSGNLQTLTGDVGGAVFPLANNINVNGLNGIVTTGNISPASPHQLTIGSSSGHTFVQSVEGDDLIKVFADSTGNINTRGGILLPNVLTNIETFGNVGTFTEFFALKNSILQPPTDAAGDQGVYALGSTGYVTDRFLHNYSSTGTAGANTFCGYQAGNMTLTSTSCSGFGFGVLASLTSGTMNAAFGNASLTSCSSGSNNAAINSLGLLTTGSFNVGLGQALTGLVTGSNNVGIGYHAGLNYSGAESGNITIGSGAQAAGIAGENNIIRIVTNSNVGDQNIFIGQQAGNNTYTVGTAQINTGVGTAVFAALTTGSDNTAIGNVSLTALTSGSNNYAINSLGALETGSFNNGFGGALAGLVSGNYNIALGYHAAVNYTGAESSNITIGYEVNGTIGESNVLRIGNGTGTSAGNLNATFISGITGIAVTGAAVIVSAANQLGVTVSSLKYKTNIRHMSDESEDIYKLTPVIFNWKDNDNCEDQWGLIAEEVAESMPKLTAYDENDNPMSVKYHELPVLLLNEIKKLKKEIDELKDKIDKLPVY
jgi:hypothetical protein